jgi:uncharacterized membrane protein YqiK
MEQSKINIILGVVVAVVLILAIVWWQWPVSAPPGLAP